MSHATAIRLSFPSFWPEPGAPEAWILALAELERIEAVKSVAGPWSSWENHLAGKLPRRSVHGLFGLELTNDSAHLWGVGLLEPRDDGPGWRLSSPAHEILRSWKDRRPAEALEALAAHLLRSSVWLRLLLIRLGRNDWLLLGWNDLRRGRGQLRVGVHLVMDRFGAAGQWWEGIEREAFGVWIDAIEAMDISIELSPASLNGPSFAPLRAPLELLDAVGWWSVETGVRLPESLKSDAHLAAIQPGRDTPSARLREATAARADLRGLSPLEPVLRDLSGSRDASPAFARWADALLGRAIDTGAIELIVAEPGQARHGRGLFGDRRRRLVRWHIHDDFDVIYELAPPPSSVANGTALAHTPPAGEEN